jgi:replication fork protection complex subunit Tof1/Swi1
MLNVIDQFLETPFDMEGKKASSLLSKKRRRRCRRAPSPDSGEDAELSDDEPRKKRKEKKKKEKEQYKSAQFIGDSDEEYGDMDTFLAKEKILRDRVALAGAEAASQAFRPPGMRTHGMKKRRRRRKTSPELEDPEQVAKGSILDLSDSSSSSQDEISDGLNGSDGAGVSGSDDNDTILRSPSPKSLSSRAAVPRPTVREVNADPALNSPTTVDTPSKIPEPPTRTRRLVILSDDEE